MPVDFERYLIFKISYKSELTTGDENFVEQHFSDLYPGQDMSYIDAHEDDDYNYDLELYDFDDDEDDWSKDVFEVVRDGQEQQDNNEDEEQKPNIVNTIQIKQFQICGSTVFNGNLFSQLQREQRITKE